MTLLPRVHKTLLPRVHKLLGYAAVVACCSAWGCTSELGGKSSVPSGAGGGMAPNPPDDKTPPGGEDPLLGPVLDSGRTVLRRLTRPEYNNTVRDLLFTSLRPADHFTDSDTVADEGFDSLGAVLTIPPVLFEQYEAAATDLIDELFTRPAGDPARTAILTCETTDDACARSILDAFATRAFRRAVDPAELDRLLALKATADALGGDPRDGLKAALRGVLLSPHFLFRVEKRPVGDTTAQPVSQSEFATRLSYFLWSSLPDEELAAAAAAGTLVTDLGAQVERMLNDPRAIEFANNFAGQWLGVRNMHEFEPPSRLVFPQYDDALRDAAKQETLAFFEDLYRRGAPLTDLLTADYTVMNARLAEHYGVAFAGSGFQVTSLVDTPRRGFLTQASFLMNSSHPGSTSPPRRGKMVMERLMCVLVPPPPPGVEVELPEPEPGVTRREQLEIHRADPACSTCHSLMDPIGFGFENFDAVGAYRTEENGALVDSTGMLPGPDGTVLAFDGPVELAQVLAQDPGYAACITEKLLTYGVGRSFTAPDAQAYTSALAQQGTMAGKDDWRSWVEHVVTSEAFRTARGETL